MFWSKLCKSSRNCVWNLAFPVFISPIVWNMCENLHHESVYFKELHNQQEYYWPTIYKTGAAVVSTIKQLLDEVERDIMNYQNRGLCYLPQPSASADNADTRFDNSWYHAKTEFNNCFIIHFLNNGQKKTFICWKWLYFKTKVKVTLISLTKII